MGSENSESASYDSESDCSVVWPRVLDGDSGEYFAVCRETSTRRLVTRPVPQDLSRYYSETYHGNRHGFTARFCDRRRLSIIRQANSSNKSVRWLDVGCGDGTLLQSGAAAGWRVYGVETHPELARSRGLTVFANIQQACQNGPYDVITLWHVLEHLTSPDTDVQLLLNLLSPGGKLIIAVPDAACLAARWFGPHWLHWDVPRHVTHFEPATLTELLTNQSSQACQLKRSEFEYDLMGFAQSALNSLGFERNLFFKLLTKRPTTASWPVRVLNYLLGGALCALAAVPIGLAGRLGKGGTLIFQARR